MIGLTEAIIGGALYLLWKGGVVSKKEPAKPKTSQTKPADVSWPTTEPHEGFPPGVEPTVSQLQAKEASDVARAKAAAKGDRQAQLEIRKRERERQKALEDYATTRKAYEQANK